MRTAEQKQYHEDLLEWCDYIFPHWESMKPRFSKFADVKRLEEWEVSFRELKETLQEDNLKVDFDGYQVAKSLYEKCDQLFKEAQAFQEEIQVKSDRSLGMDEQKQYHEDLLAWCDYMFPHWESMKPTFSRLADVKRLEKWEESFRDLKETLQEDNLKVDFDGYQEAKSLYEKCDQLCKEAQAFQEEIEVKSGRSLEIDEQKQYHEDLLAWCDYMFLHWESMKPRFSRLADVKRLEKWEESFRDLKETLQEDNLKVDFDGYQEAKSLYEKCDQLCKEAQAFQEEIEVKSGRSLEIDEQKQYHEDLLAWCDNIFFHWESVKPRFSKLFDLKSLEEWEESFQNLKEKLQTNLKVDLDDYQIANSLYEKLDQLYKETYAYQELI